jgi:hypothetical protein
MAFETCTTTHHSASTIKRDAERTTEPDLYLHGVISSTFDR